MDLYVNLQNLSLMSSATDRREPARVGVKRGDALPLTVRFIRDGAPVRLDATTDITFAIKETGKYDDDPVVLEETFTASVVGTPDSDPHYTASPSLNTTELDALFFIDGDSSNDPTSLDLMGELTWIATGDTGPTSIKTFTIRIENDVYRGDEGTPTSLATPIDWLDDQLLARCVEPVRLESDIGSQSLFPPDLTPSGTLLDDAGDPIILSDLTTINITGDSVTGDAVWSGTLPDTGTINLQKNAGDWEFVYSGPSTAIDLTLSVTSDKIDPTGLTLTDGGSNTITLSNPAGLNAPSVGEIGYIASTDQIYIWNGDTWIKFDKDSVLLTGDQTIAGQKTFTGLMKATGQGASALTGDAVIVRTTGDQRYARLSNSVNFSTVTVAGFTVGTLPTPAAGTSAFVSDSTVAAAGNFGATVVGGGTNTVPVFYDGTNWIIA